MHPAADRAPVICLHEDRPMHLIGTKLAALSILQHCPELSLVISCPDPPSSFRAWAENIPNVALVSYPELAKLGWNVKPAVLLKLFEVGYSELIWVDSDIIVNGDVLSRLSCYDADTLVATEEFYWGQGQGGDFRTVAWGLIPGRDLPCTINTGIVRVTTRHRGLLASWQVMLKHPYYIQAQALPWYERPLHMIGDQEVFTALLGSTAFPDINLVLLRRGVDIAQCFGSSGFTPMERFRGLFNGLPPLIHAMGTKPWTRPSIPPQIRHSEEPLLPALLEYLRYLELELCLYTSLASQYRAVIKEDTEWMEVRSTLGKIMTRLSGNNSILKDFPLAFMHSLIRRIRRYLQIARYSTSPEFFVKESPLQ